ncbi:microcin immunity protein [Serratia sp. 3ACOL1]|nr:microcin immunity protein [Serratia sp. 3ACOL1]
MTNEASFSWVNKLAAILSFPLTVIFVSFSSLKVVGEGNSLVDIFLSFVIYIGFLGLIRLTRKFLIWFS